MINDISVHESDPLVAVETEPGNELTELAPYAPAAAAEETRVAETPVATGAVDPEFDAYMAVVKLLIGGTVEGAVELSHRLERWEAALLAAEGEAEPGEIGNTGDVARFMLVGMALDASDGLRRRVIEFAQASDVLFRFSGSMTRPLVKNRLTGIVGRPLDRAFNRLVERGQKNVDRWIELGRAEEPGARRLARKAYGETVDEFIGHLAENKELADLVQKKSVGLATEAVDEFRSRTVSADALAETLVRRILRRPPRDELVGSIEESRPASESE